MFVNIRTKAAIDSIWKELEGPYDKEDREVYGPDIPCIQVIWRDTNWFQITSADHVVWIGTGPDPRYIDICTDVGAHLWYLRPEWAQGITSTAEFALMQIIRASRALGDKQLSDMTVTILGQGRIATLVRGYLEAIGTTVVHSETARSDIVFCSLVPNGTQITYEELSNQFAGKALVDTSSSGIIDTLHLLRALDEGLIPFAAIDVHQGEISPYVKASVQDYEEFHTNLVVTDHVAGSLQGARKKVQRILADKVKEALSR